MRISLVLGLALIFSPTAFPATTDTLDSTLTLATPTPTPTAVATVSDSSDTSSYSEIYPTTCDDSFWGAFPFLDPSLNTCPLSAQCPICAETPVTQTLAEYISASTTPGPTPAPTPKPCFICHYWPYTCEDDASQASFAACRKPGSLCAWFEQGMKMWDGVTRKCVSLNMLSCEVQYAKVKDQYTAMKYVRGTADSSTYPGNVFAQYLNECFQPGMTSVYMESRHGSPGGGQYNLGTVPYAIRVTTSCGKVISIEWKIDACLTGSLTQKMAKDVLDALVKQYNLPVDKCTQFKITANQLTTSCDPSTGAPVDPGAPVTIGFAPDASGAPQCSFVFPACTGTCTNQNQTKAEYYYCNNNGTLQCRQCLKNTPSDKPMTECANFGLYQFSDTTLTNGCLNPLNGLQRYWCTAGLKCGDYITNLYAIEIKAQNQTQAVQIAGSATLVNQACERHEAQPGQLISSSTSRPKLPPLSCSLMAHSANKHICVAQCQCEATCGSGKIPFTVGTAASYVAYDVNDALPRFQIDGCRFDCLTTLRNNMLGGVDGFPTSGCSLSGDTMTNPYCELVDPDSVTTYPAP